MQLLHEALHGPGGVPALLMLDLNTHGSDGRDVLHAIRPNEALRALPIVVLSTSSNPRDVDFCYVCGANAYHVKPVQYGEYRQLLEQILGYWLSRVILHVERSAAR